MFRDVNILQVVSAYLASSPGRLERKEKKQPGTYCLRMHQNVPKILVHRNVL